MVTMVGCKRRTVVLLTCVNFILVRGVRGQAGSVTINNPASTPSLTLTGTVSYGLVMTVPQALAELKEKIQLSIAAKDYKSALDYTMTGLRVSPSDFQLLSSKAIALAKLHQYPAAIAAVKDALVVEPINPDAIYGLAELLLIAGQIDEYRAFASQHAAQIDGAYDGALGKYFSVVEAYQTKDKDQFRRIVTRSLTALPSRTGAFLRGWEFDELLSVV